jgi:hypothetical protein
MIHRLSFSFLQYPKGKAQMDQEEASNEMKGSIQKRARNVF